MVNTPAQILLISPDVDAISDLAKSLSRCGFDILHCRELEAAEALLSHNDIHAVLTLLQLAPHHGLEGLKLIQHVTTNFPRTRVVALINQIDSEVQSLVTAAGGSAMFFLPTNNESSAQLCDFLLKDMEQTKGTKGRIESMELLDDFLQNGRVNALLQPIVQLNDKDSNLHTLGVESLARVPEQYPLFKPEVLFAYASQKSRLFETDMLCIDAALREANLIKSPGKLFINVRPPSLVHPRFAKEILAKLRSFRFEPEQIVFELTEQQTVVNLADFSETLFELRQKGLQLALDDFGAGFANLKLIQDLRPDFLKLSGQFCQGLDKDNAKQVIVQSTVDMANQLRIPVILENVETPSELNLARRFGITYAQGFLFCRPSSAKVLEEDWYKKHPAIDN